MAYRYGHTGTDCKIIKLFIDAIHDIAGMAAFGKANGIGVGIGYWQDTNKPSSTSSCTVREAKFGTAA